MEQPLVNLLESTVYTECGLLRLVGDWPEPTLDELEAVLTERPKALKRPDVPFAELLGAIGGWPAIVTGVEKWRWGNCQLWNIFVEVALVLKRPPVGHFRHKWHHLVSKYGRTPPTLIKYFHSAVRGMADEILAGANSSRAPEKKQ